MSEGSGVSTSDGEPRPPLEWDDLDVPNCSECLHSMEASPTSRGSAVWWCPNCGAARIA